MRCPKHTLYRAAGPPKHAPFCETCCRIWLDAGGGREEVEALRQAVYAAPQNERTPWWLSHAHHGVTPPARAAPAKPDPLAPKRRK